MVWYAHRRQNYEDQKPGPTHRTVKTLEAIVTDAKLRTITVHKILLQSNFSMKTSALISNQSNVQGKEEQPHASSTLRFN